MISEIRWFNCQKIINHYHYFSRVCEEKLLFCVILIIRIIKVKIEAGD